MRLCVIHEISTCFYVKRLDWWFSRWNWPGCEYATMCYTWNINMHLNKRLYDDLVDENYWLVARLWVCDYVLYMKYQHASMSRDLTDDLVDENGKAVSMLCVIHECVHIRMYTVSALGWWFYWWLSLIVGMRICVSCMYAYIYTRMYLLSEASVDDVLMKRIGWWCINETDRLMMY